MSDSLKESRLLLFKGVLFVVLGLVAFSVSWLSTVSVAWFIATLFILGGIVGVVNSAKIMDYSVLSKYSPLAISIVYLIIGILMFAYPWYTTLTLTGLLAVLLFFNGAVQCMTALYIRSSEIWGWFFFSGLVSLILGALIWAGLPGTGSWVIGVFAGLNLFLYGLSLVLVAFAPVKHEESVEEVDEPKEEEVIEEIVEEEEPEEVEEEPVEIVEEYVEEIEEPEEEEVIEEIVEEGEPEEVEEEPVEIVEEYVEEVEEPEEEEVVEEIVEEGESEEVEEEPEEIVEEYVEEVEEPEEEEVVEEIVEEEEPEEVEEEPVEIIEEVVEEIEEPEEEEVIEEIVEEVEPEEGSSPEV